MEIAVILIENPAEFAVGESMRLIWRNSWIAAEIAVVASIAGIIDYGER